MGEVKDVTKAVKMPVPEVRKTHHDLVNQHAADHGDYNPNVYGADD